MKVTRLIIALMGLTMNSSIGVGANMTTSSPPKKVSLHDALFTLEEIIKDEETIHEFCYKHYTQMTRRESEIQVPATGTSSGRINKITTTIPIVKASNCAELYDAGVTVSGIYIIYIKMANSTIAPKRVYCDMETDGGGWTVFQRRGLFPKTRPRLKFNRNWKDYEEGFGNLSEEFWLGNEYIHRLSAQTDMELRVNLKDFDDNFRYAIYNTFEVGNAKSHYRLTISGYNGNAGNSLKHHNGMRFATFDFDIPSLDFAKLTESGWWFRSNYNEGFANLNGKYLREYHEETGMGILWYTFRNHHYSHKWSEMKMRPKEFYG